MIRGSSHKNLTAGTLPCKTDKTPLGRPAVQRREQDPDRQPESRGRDESLLANAPAISNSSAMIMAAPGSRSEGLRINEFPVAMAFTDHRGIMAGKLKLVAAVRRCQHHSVEQNSWLETHGQIAAPTPRGTRRVSVSMSLETSNFSPMIKLGMAMAASTTWSTTVRKDSVRAQFLSCLFARDPRFELTCKPRRTSPFASAKVLPCSRTIERAMSS